MNNNNNNGGANNNDSSSSSGMVVDGVHVVFTDVTYSVTVSKKKKTKKKSGGRSNRSLYWKPPVRDAQQDRKAANNNNINNEQAGTSVVNVNDNNDEQEEDGRLTILKGLSGSFAPGKMTAVMGPSGSGKSTLLDVLCGRKNRGTLSGSILFNGAKASSKSSSSSSSSDRSLYWTPPTRDAARNNKNNQQTTTDANNNNIRSRRRQRTVNVQKLVGYVEQCDTLVGELTAGQMLSYTAALKLPQGTTATERQKRVDEVIAMLDLSSCRDTVIGSPLVRGISGGQAKRVNIGLAMITRPRVLLLDEPTSGLDSRTADEVVMLLKQLARGDNDGSNDNHQKRTVVCTIHSPTGRGFSQFDDLHMLHGGSTIYDGPVNMAQKHFEEALGYPRDLNCSLPEWLVDLTSDMPAMTTEDTVSASQQEEEARGSTDFSNLFQNSHAHRASLKSREMISASFATTNLALSKSSISTSSRRRSSYLVDSSSHPPPGVSEWSKLGTLLRFRMLAHYRNGEFLGTRFGDKIVFAVLILSLYFGIGEENSSQSIASTASLLYFICAICGYGAAAFVPSLTLERNLYYRELADGCYKPGTYYMAKFIEEGVLAIVTSLVFCVIVFFGCKLQGSFLIFVVSYYLTTMMGIILAYAVAAVAPSMEAANAILPTLVTIWMYFGGLFIVFDKIPVGWYWFSWTSFLRYAWGALMLNQFQDQVNGELPVFFGDGGEPLNVLEFYGMRPPIMGSVGACLGLLVALLGVFAVLGILGLKFVRHDKR